MIKKAKSFFSKKPPNRDEREPSDKFEDKLKTIKFIVATDSKSKAQAFFAAFCGNDLFRPVSIDDQLYNVSCINLPSNSEMFINSDTSEKNEIIYILFASSEEDLQEVDNIVRARLDKFPNNLELPTLGLITFDKANDFPAIQEQLFSLLNGDQKGFIYKAVDRSMDVERPLVTEIIETLLTFHLGWGEKPQIKGAQP